MRRVRRSTVRLLGTLGTIGCFSFFSNKNMTTGEGGMLTTDDDELAATLRLLRSHGMTTLTWDRHRGHAASYDVVAPGYNYRIDEMRAAIGRVQLGKLAGEQRPPSHCKCALRDASGPRMPGNRRALSESSGHFSLPHSADSLPEDTDRAAIHGADEGAGHSNQYPLSTGPHLYRV